MCFAGCALGKSSSTTGPLAIEFTVDSSHPYAMYADRVHASRGHDEVTGHALAHEGLAEDAGYDKNRGHDDGYASNSVQKHNR